VKLTSEVGHDEFTSKTSDIDKLCSNQQIPGNSDQTVLIAMGIVFAIIVIALFILLPKWKPGWPRY
jgi:hypothetical protein